MIPKELEEVLMMYLIKYWKVLALIFYCISIGLLSLVWLPKDNPIEQIAEKH